WHLKIKFISHQCTSLHVHPVDPLSWLLDQVLWFFVQVTLEFGSKERFRPHVSASHKPLILVFLVDHGLKFSNCKSIPHPCFDRLLCLFRCRFVVGPGYLVQIGNYFCHFARDGLGGPWPVFLPLGG